MTDPQPSGRWHGYASREHLEVWLDGQTSTRAMTLGEARALLPDYQIPSLTDVTYGLEYDLGAPHDSADDGAAAGW